MNFRLLLVLAIATHVLSLIGCGPAPLRAPSYEGVEPEVIGRNEPEVAETAIPQRPVMWEVIMDDKSSWLFGTVHLGITLDEALPPPYDQQISYARTIVLETDPAGVDEDLLIEHARLPRNTTQSSMFSQADWSELVFELRSKTTADSLNATRPWLSMVLLSAARAEELGHGAMDTSLIEMAGTHGKPIRYLETPRQQLELIASVSDETMVSMVQKMLADREAENRDLQELMRLYRVGDVDELTNAVFDPEDVQNHRDYFETMFTLRNDNWIDALEEELQLGDAFIAVGAGHLLGGRGLLSMLRERGYELRQVE